MACGLCAIIMHAASSMPASVTLGSLSFTLMYVRSSHAVSGEQQIAGVSANVDGDQYPLKDEREAFHRFILHTV